MSVTQESRIRFTKHALRRMRQRGISRAAVEKILLFGRPYHTQDSCTAFFITRSVVCAARLRGIRLDDCQGMAVIENSEGKIVTVEHVSRVPRGWQLA